MVLTPFSILPDEGVYVNTFGKVSKNIVLQWGEMPTSVAFIGTGQIMGWGNKAIEIRGVETGHLDGVFMHKKAQKLKFLCERNDKVCTSQRVMRPYLTNQILPSIAGILFIIQGRFFVPNILHDSK